MDIKEICRQNGTTMTEVAHKIGTSRNNIAATMRNNPTLSSINRVATAIGITPQLLVELLNKN